MPQTTDPTFYRTPADAIAAPPERLAYVAAYDPAGQAKDAITVLDTDPSSPDYGTVVGWSELPTAGNELHHFGWNACSSALGHQGHAGPLERRYLIVPGIRSSRTYVLDTKPDPRNPNVVHEITAEELASKAGYSRPHTLHCGPGGIFMSALGGAGGDDGPGGVALLDHDTFDVVGAWEHDRGEQYFAYDVWWHLNHDTVITSEWATPSMFEDGLDPEDLLGRRFGHHLNFWSMSQRTLTQRVDLGDAHQLVFEVRPAHDPAKAWGFVGVVISVEDLSGSVWLWHRDGDRWAVSKVVTIPAEPADPDELPPALKQFDVSDPFHPRETGSVRLGGVVRRQPHPAAPDRRPGGGPQMVEVSRDGRRVYVTNSLYGSWDPIFYPDGVGAWMARFDADLDGGGIAADPRFFPNGDDFRGLRVHQTRLQGGDASSDSYCYTS